jgi:hypothetical protein
MALILFSIVWNWRFVGVTDTTSLFFLYIRTEFLFYYVLSFLSVALLVFSRSLYNNHDNRIGLSEALIFNPFRISRAAL